MARRVVVLTVVISFICLLLATPDASAQGVTVITGRITVNGAPVPAGTRVSAVLATSPFTTLATDQTGVRGMAQNQFRLDIHDAGFDGRAVSVTAGGQSVAVVLKLGQILTLDFAQQVGPTGDKGPSGDKGPIGDRGQLGDRGDKGSMGDQGPQGDKGPAGGAGPVGPKGPPGPGGGSIALLSVVVSGLAVVLATAALAAIIRLTIRNRA